MFYLDAECACTLSDFFCAAFSQRSLDCKMQLLHSANSLRVSEIQHEKQMHENMTAVLRFLSDLVLKIHVWDNYLLDTEWEAVMKKKIIKIIIY